MTLTVGSSAPQEVCWWHQAVGCSWHAWGMGCHPERPRQAWAVGAGEPHEIKKIQAQGLVPESTQPIQAGEWKDWEQPCWNLTYLGYPWMGSWTSKEARAAGQCRWSCPSTLHWWGLTWSTGSRCGVFSTGETLTCWSVSRRETQKRSKGWNTSPLRTGWESWGYAA